MHIKILAPINSLKEAEKVIEAGADELYCGVIDKELIKNYKIPFVNRRPFSNCNLNSFDELQQVVDYCHARKVEVYVTLNEPVYTEKQYQYLEENLKYFCKLGVDAVIISDFGLLNFIREKKFNIKIHISTCASIYNEKGVDFCREYGASRVVLPRHMTLKEIKDLTKDKKDIEYEVIILNTNCQYDDGYCTYEHSLGNYTNDSSFQGGGCGAIEEIKVFIKKGASKSSIPDIESEFRKRQKIFNSSCGVCALQQLEQAGIDSLKIVGREYITEKKVKDVEFLYRVIKLVKKYSDNIKLKDFIRSEYEKKYSRKCNSRCYY